MLPVNSRKGLVALAITQICISHTLSPVSYTHLDVYKRQVQEGTHQELLQEEGPYKAVWDIYGKLETEASMGGAQN